MYLGWQLALAYCDWIIDSRLISNRMFSRPVWRLFVSRWCPRSRRSYLGNGIREGSEEKKSKGGGSTMLVLFPVLQHHSSSSIYQRRSCWHRILNETTFGRTYVRTDRWTDRWTFSWGSTFPSFQGRPKRKVKEQSGVGARPSHIKRWKGETRMKRERETERERERERGWPFISGGWIFKQLIIVRKVK